MKRRVGRVADGAVVDGVGLAGRDHVEDARPLHPTDRVRRPAHQRPVVHLRLQSSCVSFVTGLRAKYFPAQLNLHTC